MAQHHLSDEPVVIDQHPLGFGPSLWEIVWQRKAYVVFGIVLGSVLGVLFYFMVPKTYESTAQIFVVKKQPDRPISASASANPNAAYAPAPVEDFLDTHQTILKSAVVVNKAIEKEQLAELPTFQDSTRPAATWSMPSRLPATATRRLAGSPIARSSISLFVAATPTIATRS